MQRFHLISVALLVALATTQAVAISVSILHEFQGGRNDGGSANANGILSADGSILYGTTARRGGKDHGILWQINTDGSGYTVLHRFNAGTDGSQPRGALALDGNQLFGTTFLGGPNNDGTVWTFDLSANTFNVLHALDNDNGDGNFPKFGLSLSGTTLFGTADSAGSAPTFPDGTLFKLQTDGSGFTVLHDFAIGTPANGGTPTGKPLVVGTRIFGGTNTGGANGDGILYVINDDGSGFEILHAFDGTDGARINGGLVAIGSTLYGMTNSGGDHNDGTLFSINSDGSNFSVLHHFNMLEGDSPLGGLTLGLDAVTLFGVTSGGGTGDRGTVFSFDTMTSMHTLLHSFPDDLSDGRIPSGLDAPVLSLDGSTLFGTTRDGGPTGGEGTIWRLDLPGAAVPEPATAMLGLLAMTGLLMRRRRV